MDLTTVFKKIELPFVLFDDPLFSFLEVPDCYDNPDQGDQSEDIKSEGTRLATTSIGSLSGGYPINLRSTERHGG